MIDVHRVALYAYNICHLIPLFALFSCAIGLLGCPDHRLGHAGHVHRGDEHPELLGVGLVELLGVVGLD